MWVHNRFMYQTGTLLYENDQVVVSGLKSYNSPYLIQTGVKFAVVDRNRYVQRDKDSQREQHDVLTTQFGWDEIKKMVETGMSLETPGRIRLIHRGQEYRGIYVDDMGQPYNKSFMPIGLIQIIFERRIPVAD